MTSDSDSADSREWTTPNEVGFPTRVFKPDGNTMVEVRLRPDDHVEWVKNGYTGSYKGRVVRINRCTVRVELTSHNGRLLSPPRQVNVSKGFLHAWRLGMDLSLGNLRELQVDDAVCIYRPGYYLQTGVVRIIRAADPAGRFSVAVNGVMLSFHGYELERLPLLHPTGNG